MVTIPVPQVVLDLLAALVLQVLPVALEVRVVPEVRVAPEALVVTVLVVIIRVRLEDKVNIFYQTYY